MHIGIWVDDSYNETIGGGYSYYSKLIKAIDEYQFADQIKVSFVTVRDTQFSFNKELIYLPLAQFKISFKKQIILKISTLIRSIKKQLLEEYFREKAQYQNGYRINILNKKNVNILFYPLQTQKEIEDFPFIATNWDIGHKSTFSFPELSNNTNFDWRNKWYSETLQQALFIFTESEAGKKELIKYSNIFPEAIKVVPLFSGDLVNKEMEKEKINTFLSDNNIVANQYYFYPAQFWAHKNHYNLLRAFFEVQKKRPNFKLVFTGSEQGNLAYIKNIVKEMYLEENVLFLGFRSLQEINTLYKNAIALVYPSFLGPTNMPLLEARELKCPVLCSDLVGHKELMQDAALYFSPNDYNDIKYQMIKILKNKTQEKLKKIASENLLKSKNTISYAIKTLEQNFIEISNVRKCWSL